MPELPEVEHIRRGLDALLPGRRISSVELLLPKLFQAGDATSMQGAVFARARRLGKFLALDLEDERTLVLHFNLAGQLVLQASDGSRFCGGHPVPAFDAPLPHKSTRLILGLADGGTLFVTDIRTFGSARLLPTPDADAFLAAQKRGPDALTEGHSPREFRAHLQRHKVAPIKALLLDQGFISGLGNIYADEALFLARIHPATPSASLSAAAAERLQRAVSLVIDEAVVHGVAQILKGRALAAPGQLPRIHGRQGEPCTRCGGEIVKVVVAQRGTYFCPKCQRPPRPPQTRRIAKEPADA